MSYNACRIIEELLSDWNSPALVLPLDFLLIETKNHIRTIDPTNTDDDAKINEIIRSVCLFFEQQTNHILSNRDFTSRSIYEYFANYTFSLRNVKNYVNILYYPQDWDEDQNTLKTSLDIPANYWFELETPKKNGQLKLKPSRVLLLPTAYCGLANIDVTINAGYVDIVNDLPADIKTIISKQAAYVYDNNCSCADSLAMDLVGELYNKYKVVNSLQVNKGIVSFI
jgi:hypothetical protein